MRPHASVLCACNYWLSYRKQPGLEGHRATFPRTGGRRCSLGERLEASPNVRQAL